MAKKWGRQKNVLLASLAEFVPHHFQNCGTAPGGRHWGYTGTTVHLPAMPEAEQSSSLPADCVNRHAKFHADW